MSYRMLLEKSRSPFFLICEHASNYMPEKYNDLGLDKQSLKRHMAYDIGAEDVTVCLSEKLEAAAILGTVSRLVVDINRPLDHPTLMTEKSEDVQIPGNKNISQAEFTERIETYYYPFHEKVKECVDQHIDAGQIPFCVNIHSYTPVFMGEKRPWHIGFLWAQDSRPVGPMKAFFEDKDYIVGDNQPYNARCLGGTTLNKHCDDRRLPSLLVEIRQDLIDTPEKAQLWADMLFDTLSQLDASYFSHYRGPLKTFDPEESLSYFDNLAADIIGDSAA